MCMYKELNFLNGFTCGLISSSCQGRYNYVDSPPTAMFADNYRVISTKVFNVIFGFLHMEDVSTFFSRHHIKYFPLTVHGLVTLD